MNYDEFRYNVVVGSTYVTCPQISYDMDEGWEDEMDDMVGMRLLTVDKTAKAVILQHPDGDRYSFGYRFIEFSALERMKIFLGEATFLITEYIDKYYFADKVLANDFKVLQDLPGIYSNDGKETFTISSEHLAQIQEKCPRVIGALLSNKLMERVF